MEKETRKQRDDREALELFVLAELTREGRSAAEADEMTMTFVHALLGWPVEWLDAADPNRLTHAVAIARETREIAEEYRRRQRLNLVAGESTIVRPR